jgi:hypothetical protein
VQKGEQQQMGTQTIASAKRETTISMKTNNTKHKKINK